MRSFLRRSLCALIVASLGWLASPRCLRAQTRGPAGEMPPPHMSDLPDGSSEVGGPGGKGGLLGLGWLHPSGAPAATPVPATAEQDPLWNTALAQQDAYAQNLDPPFDPGDPHYRFFVNAGS